jgi:hypothetical protein
MVRVIEDLIADWRHLDERIEGLSAEIEAGPPGRRLRASDERPRHRLDHLSGG